MNTVRAPTHNIRKPAAAGRFYPNDPVKLRALVTDLLDAVSAPPGPVPKALIVPHAGYVFSGPIAATAYSQLRLAAEMIKRVVLLGPSHFVALDGVATSSAQAFATPLGVVQVDRTAVTKLAELPIVQTLDEAHAYEHSLEVQLPFLQVLLKDFAIVPLVSGETSPDEIADVLESVWGGPETCLIISSDLSHYLEPEAGRRVDLETANGIERLAPEAIGEDQACGRIPIRGLLRAAAAHQLHPHVLDLRNSGDTGGPRNQVVGYGAFAFTN